MSLRNESAPGIHEDRVRTIVPFIRTYPLYALSGCFLHECGQPLQKFRAVRPWPGSRSRHIEVGVVATVVVFLAAVLSGQQKFAMFI